MQNSGPFSDASDGMRQRHSSAIANEQSPVNSFRLSVAHWRRWCVPKPPRLRKYWESVAGPKSRAVPVLVPAELAGGVA